MFILCIFYYNNIIFCCLFIFKNKNISKIIIHRSVNDHKIYKNLIFLYIKFIYDIYIHHLLGHFN
jgi:hypothetical protein